MGFVWVLSDGRSWAETDKAVLDSPNASFYPQKMCGLSYVCLLRFSMNYVPVSPMCLFIEGIAEPSVSSAAEPRTIGDVSERNSCRRSKATVMSRK